jgi:SAM-dependent methyltransferase
MAWRAADGSSPAEQIEACFEQSDRTEPSRLHDLPKLNREQKSGEGSEFLGIYCGDNMKGGIRGKLKDTIIRSRIPLKGPLARGYLRVCEGYRSLRGGRERGPDATGLVLPPPRLRVLVTGSTDADMFLRSGEAQAGYLRELLAGKGRPLDDMEAIMDFGCGCGRIVRWFADLSQTQVDGCDYNHDLIEWCNENLPFMNARETALAPPLPYPDQSFDLIYAFSVFTHLSVELADLWMEELHRVTKPDGLLWFTIHGDSYRDRLLPEQKASFDAGEIVVWFPEIEGTNLCGAYWPERSVQRMLGTRFEGLAHFDPQADPATAKRAFLAHDAYLARRV